MGRGGNVRVRFGADTTDLQRGTRTAERDLNRFERSGRKSMDRLKAATTIAGTALVGGLVIGLKESADAAIEAEKSQARLKAQLKASDISFSKHRDEIERTISAHSRLSGLDDEDLTDAFTNIVRITGDVDKSLRLTGLAADFARAKHIDVAKAGELVGKVAGGNTGILSRYGIQIEKGASASEALAVLQSKFAGQAEGYGKTTAGSMDRMKVAVENLAEKVGSALAPVIADVADRVSKFAGEMETGRGAGGRFAAKLKDLYDRIKPVVQFFVDHPKLIAVAVGAWAAYKVAALIALSAIKIQNFRKAFAKSVPVAAEQGAVAGTAYAGAFDAASAKGVGKMGRRGSKWMLAVRGLGVASAALIAAEVAQAIIPGDNSLTGDVDGDGVKNNVAGKTPAGYRDTPAGAQQKERTDAAQPGKGTPDRLKTKKLPGGFPKKKTVKAVGSRSGLLVPARGGRGGIGRTSAVSPPPLAQYLVRMFALRYTSGWRSPERNAAVGGVEGSWHTKGSSARPGAIDLVGSMAGMQAALAWAKENVSGLAEAMIHDVGSGLHLHLAGTGVMNWTSAGGNAPSGGAKAGRGGASAGQGGSKSALPAGTPYASEITAAAREFGISPALLAGLIKQESGFDPNVVSKAGAVGLTQLMPGTARGLGVTDPTNPTQSIRGGAKYLKQQLDRFGGNVSLALAAYNAGPGAVDKYGGIPPYAETQNYVKKVTANAKGFGGGNAAAASFERWRMTPARRFALRLAGAESAEALAGTTPGSRDDLRAQRRLERVKLARIKRIDRTLRGRVSPEKRAELISERAQLVGEVFGHRDTRADLRLRTPAYEQSLAQADVEMAMAEQTPGSQDDLAAWYVEATAKQSRLSQVKRALRGKGLSRAKRGELLGEQASLVRDLGGLRERYDELKNPSGAPTQFDFLGAELTRAGFTDSLTDDRDVLARVRDARQADYDAALRTADPRDDIEAGGALREAIDALKNLDGTIEEANRLQQQRDELAREQVDNQRKIIALAQQGPQILAAVVAAVNGDLGGKVGLGFQSVGFAPGTVASY